ncbi:hypothetical protein IAT38_004672 [Cryptococcus sp. DSM 104549]
MMPCRSSAPPKKIADASSARPTASSGTTSAAHSAKPEKQGQEADSVCEEAVKPVKKGTQAVVATVLLSGVPSFAPRRGPLPSANKPPEKLRFRPTPKRREPPHAAAVPSPVTKARMHTNTVFASHFAYRLNFCLDARDKGIRMVTKKSGDHFAGVTALPRVGDVLVQEVGDVFGGYGISPVQFVEKTRKIFEGKEALVLSFDCVPFKFRKELDTSLSRICTRILPWRDSAASPLSHLQRITCIKEGTISTGQGKADYLRNLPDAVALAVVIASASQPKMFASNLAIYPSSDKIKGFEYPGLRFREGCYPPTVHTYLPANPPDSPHLSLIPVVTWATTDVQHLGHLTHTPEADALDYMALVATTYSAEFIDLATMEKMTEESSAGYMECRANTAWEFIWTLPNGGKTTSAKGGNQVVTGAGEGEGGRDGLVDLTVGKGSQPVDGRLSTGATSGALAKSAVPHLSVAARAGASTGTSRKEPAAEKETKAVMGAGASGVQGRAASVSTLAVKRDEPKAAGGLNSAVSRQATAAGATPGSEQKGAAPQAKQILPACEPPRASIVATAPKRSPATAAGNQTAVTRPARPPPHPEPLRGARPAQPSANRSGVVSGAQPGQASKVAAARKPVKAESVSVALDGVVAAKETASGGKAISKTVTAETERSRPPMVSAKTSAMAPRPSTTSTTQTSSASRAISSSFPPALVTVADELKHAAASRASTTDPDFSSLLPLALSSSRNKRPHEDGEGEGGAGKKVKLAEADDGVGAVDLWPKLSTCKTYGAWRVTVQKRLQEQLRAMLPPNLARRVSVRVRESDPEFAVSGLADDPFPDALVV